MQVNKTLNIFADVKSNYKVNICRFSMELCSQIWYFSLNVYISKDLCISNFDGSRFATVIGTIVLPPFFTEHNLLDCYGLCLVRLTDLGCL
jgi:hypothetical protein